MPSKIAIIMPTYNRAHMVRESLDSIYRLNTPIHEIIVVNDGSTDDTETFLRTDGRRAVVITKPNGGKASAHNAGLRICTSDYILFCDDDDLLAPSGVEALAAALDSDPSLDFAYGRFMTFRDINGQRRFEPPLHWMRESEPSVKINFLEGMFTQFNAIMVRRRAYEQVGYFREDLVRSQDYDMAVRLARHGKSIYVPTTVFHMRKHSGLRGSSADLFPESAIDLKWMRYGGVALRGFRDTFGLEEFTPTFALHRKPELAIRAALIERAYASSRRALWDEVLEDLALAGQLGPAPATPEELQLAALLSATELSLNALCENVKWIHALQASYETNAFCRQVIHTALRAMTWQAKKLYNKGDAANGLQRLRLLFHVVGAREAAARLIAAALT